MSSSDSLSKQIADDFEGHMGIYSDADNFKCIFNTCSFESHSPLDCLLHMGAEHNFVISNLASLSMLPYYLSAWTVAPPPLVEAELYGAKRMTIDPANSEEIKLRNLLHKMMLDRAMERHEYERTQRIESIPCLFCKDTFTGTWHEYLQMLFDVHRFNPGRPQNLVYIESLVAHLRAKLNANCCIHCGQHFDKPHQLKAHMKKKPHDKIPDSKYYDRFYMVNYLEEGRKWREIAQEGDCDGAPESIEEGIKDFENETEVSETKCLICDFVAPTPMQVAEHMVNFHQFDLAQVTKEFASDFYKLVKFVNYARMLKNQNKCFICGESITGYYAEHIHMHDVKTPADTSFLYDDKYLIPVIESDPLITILEDNVEK